MFLIFLYLNLIHIFLLSLIGLGLWFPFPGVYASGQGHPSPTIISLAITDDSFVGTTIDPYVHTHLPSLTSYEGRSLHIALRKGKRSYTVVHHISNFVSYCHLTPYGRTFIYFFFGCHHSSYIQEVLQKPGWYATMVEELNALHSNKTWLLVPLSSDKKVIRSK